MATILGQRVGPYEILFAAGARGKGEGSRARDNRLNRIIAIQVVPDPPRSAKRAAMGA